MRIDTSPMTKIPVPKVKRMRKKWNGDQLLALLFLAPSAVLLFIFVYGFIGWTGYVSLSNWTTLVPDFSFAGLRNYVMLFQDFRFQSDLRNTVFSHFIFIGAVIVSGLALAILLDQKIKGNLFSNLFFFPMAPFLRCHRSRMAMDFKPVNWVNLFLKTLGIQPKWYTDTNILAGFVWGKLSLVYLRP